MFTADYSSSRLDDTMASTTPLAPPPAKIFGSSQMGTVSKLQFAQRSTQSSAQYSSPPQPQQYSQSQSEARTQNRQQNLVHDRSPAQQRQFRSSFRNLSQIPSMSTNANLARDAAQALRSRPAPLSNDRDQAIIQTEQVLRRYAESPDPEALPEDVKDLLETWQDVHEQGDNEYDDRMDSGSDSKPFQDARYLATLLLRLYNSPETNEDQSVLGTAEILLNWLNEFHTSPQFEAMYDEVVKSGSNPANHELFWDLLQGLVARGKFETVIQILEQADFRQAVIEKPQGVAPANYDDVKLSTITVATETMRKLLGGSPALATGDWQIDGAEWSAFRDDVAYALEELTDLAQDFEDSELLDAELDAGLISAPEVRRGLPYEIYDRIRTIYMLLLGSTQHVLASCDDWLEASILLTVWWPGNNTSGSQIQQWSFDVSRAQRSIDVDANEDKLSKYLARLKEAFLHVTDPRNKQGMSFNTQSPLDCGFACILQGELASALSIVQQYSLCIASALAEIGSWSGWFTSKPAPEGLDEADLLLITNGAKKIEVTKDSIIEAYIQALSERDDLSLDADTLIESWEVTISLASRLDSSRTSQQVISGLLDSISVASNDTSTRLVTLLEDLSLPEQARTILERSADTIVQSGDGADYGRALLCYARSHNEHKVRQLIDLLNSYCLVSSTAYPAESSIDSTLKQLVSSPKTSLRDLQAQDPHAVETLQFHLVGYACIRKFYTTRDSSSSDLSSTEHRRICARALVAAINSAADAIYGGLYDPERATAIQVDCLLTLLGEACALLTPHQQPQPQPHPQSSAQNSAADDDAPSSPFTQSHLYALLAATEDLSTCSTQISSASEECLLASLRSYTSGGTIAPPNPQDMLKKSMSSGTGSGMHSGNTSGKGSTFSFSMMGSEMLSRSTSTSVSMGTSGQLSEASTGGDSGVLIGVAGGRRSPTKRRGNQKQDKVDDGIKRGWDWREIVTREIGRDDIQAKDVLGLLRRKVALELSFVELDGAGY